MPRNEQLREEAESREVRSSEDTKRREEEALQKRMANQEARAKFETERRRLQEAQRINESIGTLLRDMDPRLGNIEADREAALFFSSTQLSPLCLLPRNESVLRTSCGCVPARVIPNELMAGLDLHDVMAQTAW